LTFILPETLALQSTKFIDPEDRQRVWWAPYIVLENRLFLLEKPAAEDDVAANTILRTESDGEIWVDPATPEVKSCRRIVVWHTFVEK
jgi:hypothetical protein